MIDPLYQKEILKLAGQAAGAGRLDSPAVTLTLKNPLCGDQIRLDVAFDQAKVAALAHETRACVLCQASASLIARLAPGQSKDEVREARDLVVAMLSGNNPVRLADGVWSAYEVFTPVVEHPARHKCVTLPLDALIMAFGEHRGA